MVTERFLRRRIFAEALSPSVVVVIHPPSVPRIMTFDAEMIISVDGKLREAVTRLQKALCEGYAGRNAATVHFLDSKTRELADVPLLRRHHAVLSREAGHQKKDQRKDLIW